MREVGQRSAPGHRSAQCLRDGQSGLQSVLVETISGPGAAKPGVAATLNVVQPLLGGERTDIGATEYEGIRAVPGGAVLTINFDGATTLRRYWEPHADPAHERRDEAYYIETYRRVLTAAVECRLCRATAPAGLLTREF